MDDSGDRPAPDAVRLGALGALLGYHVAQAAVATHAVFVRQVGKPCQLRKAEFSLLALLLANGALTPRQLARTLALAAPALTMLLDRLQARQLLRRQRNPSDGRSQHVVLSARGRRLAEAAATAAATMEDELLQRLSSAEQAMLIELLGRLAAGTPARHGP